MLKDIDAFGVDNVFSFMMRGVFDYVQSGQSIESFLADKLGSVDAKQLNDYIKSLGVLFGEVARARMGGQSPAVWLQAVLTAGGVLGGAELAIIAKMFGEELDSDSPSQLGAAILRSIYAGMYVAGSYEVNDLGEVLPGLDVSKLHDVMEQFLKSPMGDDVERGIIAAAASGILEGMRASGRALNFMQASMLADVALHIAKVGWKVQSNELGVDEASELVEDRIAANIGAAARHIFESRAPHLGAALGTMLEAQIPMGGAAILMGRRLGAMVGESLGPQVEQGVQAVTRALLSTARVAAKAAKQEVVSFAKRLYDGVFG